MRNTFEMYWSYYLSIEDMLQRTNQYVTHSADNQNTYSDEFTKIILLSCSEVDSLLKIYCEYKEIPKKGKYYNMASYASALQGVGSIIDYADYPYVYATHSGILLRPFEEINVHKEYAGLNWWRDYQKIKHNRLENFDKGTLYNAACSVAAQYIILRILIDFLDESSGREYVEKNNSSKFWLPVV